MRRAKLTLAIAAGLLLAAIDGLADTVSAKKDGTEVYSDAAKTSSVITKLKKDEELEAKDRKGMFWEVLLPNGKTGYIPVLAVNRKASDKGSLAKAIRSAVKEGRDSDSIASTRSRAAVMGVRGLDESQDTAFAGTVRPNLRLVYDMEDRLVDDKEIEEFGSKIFQEIEVKSKKSGNSP